MARKVKPKTCNGCPLETKREVRFKGQSGSKVVLVGEAPWKEEVAKGEPFVGDLGKELNTTAHAVGLPLNKIVLANAARCMIDKKQMTTKEIKSTLEHCRVNLERLLQSIKPKLVILLGDFAMRQVLKKSGVKQNRGQFIWSKEFECWCLATYHPGAFMMRRALKGFFVEDLRYAAEFMKNGYERPKDEKQKNYVKVETIRPLLDGKVDCPYGAVGFDTEGQGLDWVSMGYVVRSFSISHGVRQGWNIELYEEPVDQEEAEFWILEERLVGKKKEIVNVPVKKSTNFDTKLAELREFAERADLKKFMFHGKFDLHVVDRLYTQIGLEPPVWKGYVMDVQPAMHLLDENLYAHPDLNQARRSFTTMKEDYDSAFAKKYPKGDMLAVPSEDLTYYAAADADVSREAGITIAGQLAKCKRLQNYFRRFVQPTVAKGLRALEWYGAAVDREEMPKTAARVNGWVKDQTRTALFVVPKKILTKPDHVQKGLKLTRDDLVRDILFSDDGFGLEPVKKTKGGDAWSVDKEVVKRLREKVKPKSKPGVFLEAFSKFNEYDNLRTTIEGFGKNIREDGRIHSSFSIAVAATGRASSRKPNMQNNPKRSASAKEVRRLLVAPPGMKLMAVDQSQAELRWCAHLSQDPKMLEIYNEGLDIHRETAKGMSESMGKKWDSLDEKEQKQMRQNAKPINFGVIYLMSPDGLVHNAYLEYGLIVTHDQASRWIDGFFSKYPGVRRYHKSTIQFGRKYGWVESPLGRRRRLPELQSKMDFVRSEAERMAVNHKIQSPSSDICLMALNELWDAGVYKMGEFEPSQFVHDELIFAVREDKVMKYAKMVKEVMENPPLQRDFGFKLSVPLLAEIKIGDNAAEMKELEV